MNNLMEYMGYLGSVEYSAPDEIFYGRIIEISDRVTYDGDSVQALKNAFIEAADDYIESCAEVGKAPEISCQGNLSVQIAPELHRKLVGIAAEHNRPLDKTIEDALRQFALSV